MSNTNFSFAPELIIGPICDEIYCPKKINLTIKFSFSEKATKIKTIKRMAYIFGAFSEKLNFE